LLSLLLCYSPHRCITAPHSSQVLLLLCVCVIVRNQALNDILSGLASIDESGMSADEIRQLLNIPTQQPQRSRQAAAPAAARPASVAEQQAQQQLQRRQQQQQRAVGPDELQRTARQLGQLSPELAQEWHDRALRQSLEQVRHTLI
jgi:DNA-binding transcriptional MerR regulator